MVPAVDRRGVERDWCKGMQLNMHTYISIEFWTAFFLMVGYISFDLKFGAKIPNLMFFYSGWRRRTARTCLTRSSTTSPRCLSKTCSVTMTSKTSQPPTRWSRDYFNFKVTLRDLNTLENYTVLNSFVQTCEKFPAFGHIISYRTRQMSYYNQIGENSCQ